MLHLGTKEIETDRLLLRRFREDDAEEIFYGFVNQEDFLYYANKKKRTLEEEKESLKRVSEKYNNLEYYNWLITRKEDNKIIGSANLVVFNINECVEINYAIDNRYSKNGYMTEALKCIIEYCFKELKVQRFQAGCVVENVASRKVMQKANMKEEGILRKYIILQDGYHDMYMYSIVKEEYNV